MSNSAYNDAMGHHAYINEPRGFSAPGFVRRWKTAYSQLARPKCCANFGVTAGMTFWRYPSTLEKISFSPAPVSINVAFLSSLSTDPLMRFYYNRNLIITVFRLASQEFRRNKHFLILLENLLEIRKQLFDYKPTSMRLWL